MTNKTSRHPDEHESHLHGANGRDARATVAFSSTVNRLSRFAHVSPPPMALAALLTASYSHCRGVARLRARNFYYGMKLTPEPKRSALYAVYAWTRQADDLVDAGAMDDQSVRVALDGFRERTLDLIRRPLSVETLAGHVDDAMWPAFVHTVQTFDIRECDLEEMILGQIDDLETKRRETFDDLTTYCHRVAATVGSMCVTIWGYDRKREADVYRLAEQRGLAFQLTNILRDFKSDFEQGRVYLPSEDFERFGIRPECLLSWEPVEACEEFMRFQIRRAEDFYSQSAELENLIDPTCAATSWAMNRIYHRLLERMAHRPDVIVKSVRPVRVSFLFKALTAVSARWRKW